MNRTSPLPESLSEGRALLALDVPTARRKQLGQCFTGLQTGRLLAALAVQPEQRRVADPMAGHGDLIESAADRASRLGLSQFELTGVEIEPEAARLCKWRIQKCIIEFGATGGKFTQGDTFDLITWESVPRFDLVITNPPYVRYQTLSNGATVGAVKLLSADATQLALERLAMDLAPPEEYEIWQKLIRSYSGLSDLSVPSWLLCGLLTAPNGVLAMVVPQTWLNRDYARLARYFSLRFFQPLAVVQESGQRWFKDAQVPVSLVVGRRLSPADVVVPLLKRSGSGETTPFAEVDSTAASSESHVGKAFVGDDPEREFAEWLNSGSSNRHGVELKRVSWAVQRDEVLAASQGCKWLHQLEGDVSQFTATEPSSVLPASVTHQLPPDFLNNLRPLASEKLRIGQGLRTGCNPFFYVELANRSDQGKSVSVLTHKIFGSRRITIPDRALKPVLRRQSELGSRQIQTETLSGRLLDLREFVLPENATQKGTVLSSLWQIMPEALAEYVRIASRTYLVRGETRTLIPHLSAVKPNGLGPDETPESSLLSEGIGARMWYMIPDFTPRHLPALCIPRIIHDEPRAILNSESPVLVDANFSTLWFENSEWSAEALFGVLNSTWGELCMEALGATLGGGALKLEATHLRRLPIPSFSGSQKEKVRRLVRGALEEGGPESDFEECRAKIDQIIISALTGRNLSVTETQASIKGLADVVLALRAKRRRKLRVKPKQTK